MRITDGYRRVTGGVGASLRPRCSASGASGKVESLLANLGGAGGGRATLYIDYPAGLCGALRA